MKYDVVIIGAGIVGLATGLRLKEKNPGLRLAIVEKEPAVARHQTGNNSGVIHAGVYYKTGSLKAQNCTTGYKKLIDFCNREGIAYDLCGKLIVATRSEELPRLENLFERAISNGLDRVKKVPAEEITAYEPHATGLAAIHVPYTGIVDYTKVSEKYAEIIRDRYQGELIFSNQVTALQSREGEIDVVTGKQVISTKLVVNTAGLYSDKVAGMTRKDLNVKIIPFRGEYSVLKPEKRYLVKNLIYPVPDPQFPFLGVHFTRLIDGNIEAGPNAVWAFRREGYKFTDFYAPEFFESLAWKGFRKVMKQYWKMGLGEYYRSFDKYALTRAMQRLVPEITHRDFEAAGAGVRAQACDRNGGLVDDFLFAEEAQAIHVLNAPSPAATASLAIGDTISDKVIHRFS